MLGLVNGPVTDNLVSTKTFPVKGTLGRVSLLMT
jgi:hypothetical protein